MVEISGISHYILQRKEKIKLGEKNENKRTLKANGFKKRNHYKFKR